MVYVREMKECGGEEDKWSEKSALARFHSPSSCALSVRRASTSAPLHSLLPVSLLLSRYIYMHKGHFPVSVPFQSAVLYEAVHSLYRQSEAYLYQTLLTIPAFNKFCLKFHLCSIYQYSARCSCAEMDGG